MPEINEKVRGDKIGKRSNDYYIWAVCPKCELGRWILKWKKSLPNFTGLCLHCNGIRFRPRWNNGMMKSSTGYIFIYKPEHSNTNSKGYVKRSRLVLERKLGRDLLPNCVPHHVNGIKDDDRPRNLIELESSSHKILHLALQRKIRKVEFSARREVVKFLEEGARELKDNPSMNSEQYAGFLFAVVVASKKLKEWGIE